MANTFETVIMNSNFILMYAIWKEFQARKFWRDLAAVRSNVCVAG